jgi:NADH:ubiquinone oxidoreductase subunit H
MLAHLMACATARLGLWLCGPWLGWGGGVWLLLCAKASFAFVLLVMVRITTPRLKLESLSRLAWQPMLGLLCACALGVLVGYL